MFFLRYFIDSELLHTLDSHFIIPEAVMMEVSAKRFSSILFAFQILY